MDASDNKDSDEKEMTLAKDIEMQDKGDESKALLVCS